MSLRHLLDTNIASYYLRRTSSALEARVSEGLLEQTVALSALTRAELRFGQAGMAEDDRRRRLIDHFLMQLPCLPWTLSSPIRTSSGTIGPKFVLFGLMVCQTLRLVRWSINGLPPVLEAEPQLQGSTGDDPLPARFRRSSRR